VSNANGTVRAKLGRVGLAGFFEIIVDSHDEGIEKPDPRIFHLALRRMGVKAAEAAYVGDLYHVDVVGAEAAGLRPFLLDPFGLHGERPVARLRALDELSAYLRRARVRPPFGARAGGRERGLESPSPASRPPSSAPAE
jgi:FMN phosphatase YigB (HAD superfamily)